jgi:hypothetical protein
MRKNIITSPFVVVLMIKRRVLPTVASHNDTFAGAVWQWPRFSIKWLSKTAQTLLALFASSIHVLIADDVMWSLLVKDDIPELASGEARASLGHSSSDLWAHVHEAFIDNSRAVPAIATQHRIFIDLASNKQYDISSQIAYINGTTTPISFSESAFTTTCVKSGSH